MSGYEFQLVSLDPEDPKDTVMRQATVQFAHEHSK
jgi:hypothetical protein